MKFMVECPVTSEADGGAWLSPDNLVEYARVAEASRGRRDLAHRSPGAVAEVAEHAVATRPTTPSSGSASAPR